MLHESSVVATLYLHTAKIAVKTFVIKQLQISKSAHFACLAWRAEYSNRFSFAAGIMLPSGTLNTGSYDAGTWPTLSVIVRCVFGGHNEESYWKDDCLQKLIQLNRLCKSYQSIHSKQKMQLHWTSDFGGSQLICSLDIIFCIGYTWLIIC